MIRSAALAAALVAGLMAGGAAQALEESDVIGTWQVDTEAYRQGLRELLEGYLAEMPEEMRAQLQEAMLAPLDDEEDVEAHAEFRPGGEMIFHATGEPPSPGTWRLVGDRVEFAHDGGEEGEPGYIATVEGGVMRAVPVLDAEDDTDLEVPLTLHRR